MIYLLTGQEILYLRIPHNESIGHLCLIDRNIFTGTKGRFPLFICNKEGSESKINNSYHNDLLLICQITDRIYKN